MDGGVTLFESGGGGCAASDKQTVLTALVLTHLTGILVALLLSMHETRKGNIWIL